MFPTRRITLGGDKFRDEYSLEIDGTNDYLNAGNDSSIQVGTSDFSICAWIKKAADGNDANIISYGVEDSGGNTRWYFRTDGSNKLEMYSYDGTGTSLISTSTITGTGWNHVALSWDRDSATGAKLYINGILDAERDGTPEQGTLNNSAQGILIGARRTTGTTITQHWNGKISDIALYIGIALTSSQVKTIYNGREPYNHKEGIASSNLVSWWRMGDGALDKFNLIGDEKTPTTGSNLVTNGTFESNITDGSWTDKNSTLAHETSAQITGSGSLKMTIDSGHASGGAYQNIGLAAGKTYNVTGKMKMTTGSHGEVTIFTSASNGTGQTSVYQGSAHELTTAGGTVSFDASFIGVSGKPSIQFACNEDSAVVLLDDVVVKEVNGNAGVMINMDSDDFTGDTP
jgi:hypothetical protein